MRALVAKFVGCLAVVATAGCTFSRPPGGQVSGSGGHTSGGTGTGGTSVFFDAAVVSDAARDLISSPDSVLEVGPSVDANCGNVPFAVTIPPPNLLILLDRSGSMNEDASGASNGGANSKWSLMTAAIKQVVAQTETSINWGLMLFGNDSSCGVATTATVPPMIGNASAIISAIDQTTAQSATPTTKGELAAGKYLSTFADPGRKFILLATDGQPTCGLPRNSGADPDDPAAIQAVADVAAMEIPTYVIGIATTNNATADATLNSMADKGGQARPTTPKYYPVSTTADLVTALGAIKSQVMGTCTYPLGKPDDNADLDKTSVMVEGASIPKDDPNGWHFDPGMSSITFSGTVCADLLAGKATKVQILYGCKLILT